MSALLSIAYGLMAFEFGRRALREGRQARSGRDPDEAVDEILPDGAPALIAGTRRRNLGASFDSALFQPPTMVNGLGIVETRLAGPAISAADMRRMSPTFRQPAKATIHRDVVSLDARVKHIRGLIRKGARDPAIRKTAIAVLSHRDSRKPGGWAVREKDWRGEAEALFRFVRKNVRYTRDSVTADTFVAAERTLFDTERGSGGGGDCDDMVITLGSLLMSVGHEVKLRVGAIKNPGAGSRPGWNHIWLMGRLPTGGAVAGKGGQWISLDASVDKPPGWEAPKKAIYRVKDFKVVG